MHELARLINLTAKADRSQPPNWTTDEVLKAVERVIIHTDGQPALFASLCRTALDGVEDVYVHALLNLGILNGGRRVDGGNEANVNSWFETCRNEIDPLPPDPRKARLDSFLHYQGRVYMARNGQYETAAKLEEEEILATSREAEMSVSMFLTSLYHLWARIGVGSPTVLQGMIQMLDMDLQKLQSATTGTTGTNLELLWGRGNGPIHMLQALLLTGQMTDPNWVYCLSVVRLYHKQLPPTLHPWIAVMEAADLLRLGRVHEGHEALHAIEEKMFPIDSDVQATINLLHARLVHSKGNLKLAREEYAAIQPVPNGHMIAAVAAKELAALEA